MTQWLARPTNGSPSAAKAKNGACQPIRAPNAVLQLARLHADFNRYLQDAALQYANSPQAAGD